MDDIISYILCGEDQMISDKITFLEQWLMYYKNCVNGSYCLNSITSYGINLIDRWKYMGECMLKEKQ